uniref:Uncharacterized protein n=1 Tax=Glossina brevipalpis TaxID=37001 RepID=A0A1A9WUA3_9MUSC
MEAIQVINLDEFNSPVSSSALISEGQIINKPFSHITESKFFPINYPPNFKANMSPMSVISSLLPLLSFKRRAGVRNVVFPSLPLSSLTSPEYNTERRAGVRNVVFPSLPLSSLTSPCNKQDCSNIGNPSSATFLKVSQTKGYRKRILKGFYKCNEQIHEQTAISEEIGRKMLQLEAEKTILLKEYVDNAKQIKKMFQNYLNKN